MIVWILISLLIRYTLSLSLSIDGLSSSPSSSLLCCNSTISLESCLNIWSLSKQRLQQINRKNSKKIALVTYVTDSIVDYASYAIAINSIFAEYNDYNYYIMSPLSHSEYEPRDQRWNRVKIIENAINPNDGFLNDMDYIVWIDADLIFINLEYSLSDIIDENTNADIIISSEWHAETGVANTGCFIAKNTNWTRDFLSRWWNNYDRSLNHDQVFFDKLYKSLYPGIRSHVTIVPPEVLNSIPPPMKYQKPHHSVLHMMGESSRLRKAVFQRGWDNVCLSPQSIPHQLNLSQPTLKSLALQIFHDRIDEIISTFKHTTDEIEIDIQRIEHIFNNVSEGREIILQINILNNNEHKNDSKVKDVLSIMYATLQHAHLRLLEFQNLVPNAAYKNMEIRFLNLCSIVGNDFSNELDSNGDADMKRSLLYEIKRSLERLQGLIDKSSSIAIKEMLGMHIHSIGQFELYHNNSKIALDHYYSSVAIFKEIIPLGGNVYHSLGPSISLGSELCSSKNEEHGLYELLSLVDQLQYQILFAEEQHKDDHQFLIEAMIKSGLCLFSLLGSSPSAHENNFKSFLLMMQYLATQSTALLSKSSQYRDNSHKLSHLYELSLLLNKQLEYLMSTNSDTIYNNTNETYSMLETFRSIMNKNKMKKLFLKRKQKLT